MSSFHASFLSVRVTEIEWILSLYSVRTMKGTHDQPLGHARSPPLNSTEIPVLQQAAHLCLKVALSKLPADLKTLMAEAAKTVPHPVLAVPSGVVTHDRNVREVPFEKGQLTCSHSSHGVASAPVIRVDMWLVTPELHGVGLCVSQEVVRVSDTRTGWDVDDPVKGMGPKVLYLASPKLDNFDVIVSFFGRHIKIWLWK